VSAEYTLVRLDDLLAIPADRRRACLGELELALGLHELAFGDVATTTPFLMTWADDGCSDITLDINNGHEVLKLEVFKP